MSVPGVKPFTVPIELTHDDVHFIQWHVRAARAVIDRSSPFTVAEASVQLIELLMNTSPEGSGAFFDKLNAAHEAHRAHEQDAPREAPPAPINPRTN